MTINYSPLSEYEFLVKYLEITNLLLTSEQQLTRSEMELIAAFTVLPEEKYKYQRFSMGAKKRVMERLKINIATINNRIHALTKKEFIRRDDDKVLYLPKHIQKVYEELKADKKAELIFKFPLLQDDSN